MTYALETRAETSKPDTCWKQSCDIQPIIEWVERGRRIRKEWAGHVTRIDAERLVKISRDNIPAGKISPGHPK